MRQYTNKWFNHTCMKDLCLYDERAWWLRSNISLVDDDKFRAVNLITCLRYTFQNPISAEQQMSSVHSTSCGANNVPEMTSQPPRQTTEITRQNLLQQSPLYSIGKRPSSLWKLKLWSVLFPPYPPYDTIHLHYFQRFVVTDIQHLALKPQCLLSVYGTDCEDVGCHIHTTSQDRFGCTVCPLTVEDDADCQTASIPCSGLRHLTRLSAAGMSDMSAPAVWYKGEQPSALSHKKETTDTKAHRFLISHSKSDMSHALTYIAW